MKHISILIALLTLAACTTSPIQQAPIDAAKKSESSSSVEESVKPEKPVAEPKITVTGTKLSKEEAQKSESSSSVEESVKPEKPVAEPKITVTGTKLSKEETQKSESSSSVEESVKPEKPVAEPKITVTGTKLSKEEAQKLETQPRLSMSFVKNTSGNNIINAISLFKSLPQPSEGMDCKGVLEALDKVGISYEVVDSNTAVIKKAFGIYTYQYMDNSCK